MKKMKSKIIGFFFFILVLFQIPSVIADTNCKNKMEITNPDTTDIINLIDESMIRYYLQNLLETGKRYTGSVNCSRAATYIYNEFKKLGLYVFEDKWSYPKYSCQNIVAMHNGTDPLNNQVIVVCAHYDTTKTSPGANDDGSGIAAMMAIANICSNYCFNKTIRFVALSGEEVGTYGSHYDAKKAYEQDENIIAVLNIDTIGYADNSNDGKIINILTEERSRWLTTFSEEIAKKYENYIDLIVQPIQSFPADHHSYIDYGYDGVMFLQSNYLKYSWMHTPEDTIDKINFTYFLKATKLLLAITNELELKQFDVQVRIVTPYEDNIYLFDKPIFKLPGLNFYRLGNQGLTYIFGKAIVRVNISTKEKINCVYFGIDNYFWHICEKPPYEWEIERTLMSFFPLFGKHILSVCVCTNTGKMAFDEMDILIFKLF
jgi:hypothetical protein